MPTLKKQQGGFIKKLLRNLQNATRKLKNREVSYQKLSNENRIKQLSMHTNHKGDFYDKIKLNNEFELFDKLSKLPENDVLLKNILVWLQKNINSGSGSLKSQSHCGLLPTSLINKLLDKKVESSSQITQILNDYIESVSSVTITNVFASLTAFVISYVVWYQKNKTNLTDNQYAKKDYSDSVQFLAQLPKKYNSACMRILDEYLGQTAKKYGLSPYPRQSHILNAANNIHNARTAQTKGPSSRPKSKSGSSYDPFA